MTTPVTASPPPSAHTDIHRARRAWKSHGRYTWFLFGVLAIVVLVLGVIGARFLKPQAMLTMLAAVAAFQVVIALNSRLLVVWLMRCVPPEPKDRERLERLVGGLLPASGLSRAPTLYVSEAMEQPNAFAFGTGLRSPHGVAVTKEILTILDDDELRSVLAHELGHIRSRDITLMTLVAVTLGMIGKISGHFRHIGRMAILFAIAIEVAVYLPRVVASGIAQLREFAADAFSAMSTGSSAPLIRAFDKIEVWDKEHERTTSPLDLLTRPTMDELQLSHPDMSIRKEFLRELDEKA